MGRRKKNRKHIPAEPTLPPNSATPRKPPGSSRAEVLQQAEAMVAHAMNYVMRIGYGDELTWPGRVARGDGFQVRITEMAIDLATERLSATCDYIGKEIAGELGVALEQPRTKYRVLPRISRDEPQAPEWFMPPEGNEPPKPSRSPSGRRNLEPSAAEDAVASRDPATATDEAAPQRQRIEGLH